VNDERFSHHERTKLLKTKEERNAYQRKWRLNHLEDRSRYEQNRRNKDLLYFVKKILIQRRLEAKRKGIPFDITLDDIKDVPAFCPILGVKLVSGEGINNPNAASLDRVVPQQGYVKGNVYWISKRANRIKCDATLEEMERVVQWIRQIRKA